MDLLEEDLSDDDQHKRAKLEDLKYSCNMEIRCADHATAQKVMLALQVDEELSPSKVVRTLAVRDEFLLVEIKAIELRLLRASTASFFDMAMVALRFVCEFS